MKLHAHGLSLELPHGWSGRIFNREGGAATLHAASFPLPLHDGEFGDQSTAHMPHGSIFVSLTEYLTGGGLEAGHGLFSAERVPRRLDPTAFATAGLAHPRPGQAGIQRFFTAARRPFCLYVVLAGGRANRRAQIAALEHVLGALVIEPRPTGVSR